MANEEMIELPDKEAVDISPLGATSMKLWQLRLTFKISLTTFAGTFFHMSRSELEASRANAAKS